MVHFQVGQSVTVGIIPSFRDHSNKINQTLICYNIFFISTSKITCMLNLKVYTIPQ